MSTYDIALNLITSKQYIYGNVVNASEFETMQCLQHTQVPNAISVKVAKAGKDGIYIPTFANYWKLLTANFTQRLNLRFKLDLHCI